MPNIKISQLPAVTLPLAGTEAIPIVQTNQTRQVAVGSLSALPAGSGTEVQYRLSSSTFGAMSGSSWVDATRALALSGASVLATQFMLQAGSINAQTGTSYTLLSSDNGKVVTLTNAGAITLTCPTGLGAGFVCTIIQLGTGQVNVVAGGGATLGSLTGLTHLFAQYAVGTIIAPTANNFVLTGQLA